MPWNLRPPPGAAGWHLAQATVRWRPVSGKRVFEWSKRPASIRLQPSVVWQDAHCAPSRPACGSLWQLAQVAKGVPLNRAGWPAAAGWHCAQVTRSWRPVSGNAVLSWSKRAGGFQRSCPWQSAQPRGLNWPACGSAWQDAQAVPEAEEGALEVRAAPRERGRVLDLARVVAGLAGRAARGGPRARKPVWAWSKAALPSLPQKTISNARPWCSTWQRSQAVYPGRACRPLPAAIRWPSAVWQVRHLLGGDAAAGLVAVLAVARALERLVEAARGRRARAAPPPSPVRVAASARARRRRVKATRTRSRSSSPPRRGGRRTGTSPPRTACG